MECSAQDDFQGVLLKSTPVERTGRKQEQAEGEVELRGRSDPRLGQIHIGLWSQNGPSASFCIAWA